MTKQTATKQKATKQTATKQTATKLKVLIPLDGSAFSHQVLPYVRQLFDPASYCLTLLRVAPVPAEAVPPPAPPRPVTVDGWTTLTDVYDSRLARELAEHPIYASQVWESFQAELKADMADDLQSLEEAGFEVSVSVRFGETAQEIVDCTEVNEFDLVVMATHGRTGLGRMLMGSVAESVLRAVHVPVMMVRPASILAEETLPLTRFALANFGV